jgi:hypothetical protein
LDHERALTLDEILEELLREDVDVPDMITVVPPVEEPGADSDQDSDNSDAEVTGNFDHLPARILRSNVSLRYENDNGEAPNSPDDPQPSTSTTTDNIPAQNYPPQPSTFIANNIPAKRRKQAPTIRSWNKNQTPSQFKIPDFCSVQSPTAEDLFRETVKCPLDALQIFLNCDFIDHVVLETNRYASQHLFHNLSCTRNEILTLIGVMLLTGYHTLPSKRLYWKSEPDLSCPLVTEAMRRNRFDSILRYLHLANNSENSGEDRMYKIRPIFNHLNSSFKVIQSGSAMSIDESIIPYFGRHGCKQFIRGKPIRFGYKLWVAADPSGYIYHAEPYCGSSTRLTNTSLGQGADVVLGLMEYVQPLPGTRLYFDNLFTSVGLLEKLTSMQIGGTGTLRENRCHASMKLPDKTSWKKKPRFETVTSASRDLLLVRWKDNNIVTVLTNCDAMEPSMKSKRYSRSEKKTVSVQIPGPIAQYNAKMGGVDLNDQFVSTYRCNIRTKKWWWPFFAWAIDVSCVQGWLLYRRLGNDIPLLDFRRQCTMNLLKTFGTPKHSPGLRPSFEFSPVLEDIRRDRIDHVIEKGVSKYRRCRVCGSRTSYLCKKCDAPLHIGECFKTFHS